MRELWGSYTVVMKLLWSYYQISCVQLMRKSWTVCEEFMKKLTDDKQIEKLCKSYEQSLTSCVQMIKKWFVSG